MYCNRKIRYLELYQGEEKCGGAGFVRIEAWGTKRTAVIQLSGLSGEQDGKREIFAEIDGKRSLIGEITLRQGMGRLEMAYMDDDGEERDEADPLAWEEIRIPLSDGCEAACKRELLTKKLEAKEAEEPVNAAKITEAPRLEEEIVTRAASQAEGDSQAEEAGDVREQIQPKTDAKEKEENKPNKCNMTLKTGKWEQLDAIYPHIAPFGDKRRYLQISPGDFVILKDKSYRKVNNSFLLHGYFSYKHLILHRIMKQGEPIYYVGVPGRFYDKEKEVAILFGFDSFECGIDPAKEGDFGYYMMRVEL